MGILNRSKAKTDSELMPTPKGSQRAESLDNKSITAIVLADISAQGHTSPKEIAEYNRIPLSKVKAAVEVLIKQGYIRVVGFSEANDKE